MYGVCARHGSCNHGFKTHFRLNCEIEFSRQDFTISNLLLKHDFQVLCVQCVHFTPFAITISHFYIGFNKQIINEGRKSIIGIVLYIHFVDNKKRNWVKIKKNYLFGRESLSFVLIWSLAFQSASLIPNFLVLC